MDKRYTIYMHKNKINGKVYIGQTCQNPERRWHRGEGYKTQSYFYSAIKKYGWDNFEHIILFEGLSLSEANEIEESLIKKHNALDRRFGYNRKYGGENYCVNADAKVRMSQNHADFSGEKNPNYGKKHSKEAKQKMSQTKKEKYSIENHPNYGKHLSKETRQKISKSKFKKVYMFDLNGNYIKSFDSVKDASIQTHTNKHCISMCCHGKLKTSGGYIWKYAS